jgi:hypothetical protein
MSSLLGLSADVVDASEIYLNGTPLDDVYVNENQSNTTLGDLTINNLTVLGSLNGATGITGTLGTTGPTGRSNRLIRFNRTNRWVWTNRFNR